MPLVPVAAATALGIVAGRYVSVPLGVWAAAAAAALAMGLLTVRREHLRALTAGSIAAAIFFGSATACAVSFWHVPDDHIVTFSDRGDVLATIRGQVVSRPWIRRAETPYWRPLRTTFLLEVHRIRTVEGGWLDTRGRVRVTVGEPLPDLRPGAEVELVGALLRPGGPRNPGQYDWRAAGRYRGELVGFRVPGADGVRTLVPARRGLLNRLWWRLRWLLSEHLARCGQAEDVMLLEALILGQRHPALRDLNRIMIDAGIAHFLSISGLHLGILLGLAYWLCRLMMFPPRRSAAVVLGLLIAYVFLAEPRPPLLRGAVMASAVCVAVLSGQAVSTPNALSAAAIVLLALDPLALFTPGFQLSFAIVAGILALHRPLRRALFGRWLRRRGLMVFRGDQRVRRWLAYRGAEWGMHLVTISLAAYLAAAPLVAYHFGLFSPLAPVMSVLLLPVIVAVLVPAYVSMALAWLAPNLSVLIGQVAATAAAGMRRALELLRAGPVLSIDVFEVPVWYVLACYVVLGLWAASGGRRRRLWAATAATAALAVATVLTQKPAPAPPAGRVHVLDVSHGQMVLLHAPDGRTYLFDAGSLTSQHPYQRVLRPFLRAMRLPSPEAVFVSHANLDHYNALPGLLQRRPPRRAYVSEWFGRRPDAPGGPGKLLRRFADRGVRVVRLRRGQVVRLAGNVKVEVLWPPPPAEAPDLDVNDTSLVLRVRCGGSSILLPGDIGPDVEEHLAELEAARIRCDVLMLPHHGSPTPTLKRFLEAAGAEVLLQSSAARRDSPELLDAAAGRRRWATFRRGWIQVDLSRQGPRVRTMRSGRVRGAQQDR